jgi:hypothetical protein
MLTVGEDDKQENDNRNIVITVLSEIGRCLWYRVDHAVIAVETCCHFGSFSQNHESSQTTSDHGTRTSYHWRRTTSA